MPRAKKEKILVPDKRLEIAMPDTPRSRRPWTVIVFVVLLLLLVGSVSAAGYFYYQLQQSGTAGADNRQEADLIKEEIGRFMELPDEMPTLATVADKTKLAEQPFFQKAENGDKVLLFTDVKKAILYRPATKKVIDVTVLDVANNKQADAASPVQEVAPVEQAASTGQAVSDNATQEAAVPITVALYNGTAKIGVTNGMEDRVITAFPDVVVEKKEKAAKNDYQETSFIDLSGKHADLTKSMAESLGGVVGTLPEGETNPGTDILVIVGNK